jgi:hypothetical protein
MGATKRNPKRLLARGEVIGSVTITSDDGTTVAGRCRCNTAVIQSHSYVVAVVRELANGTRNGWACLRCRGRAQHQSAPKRERYLPKLDGSNDRRGA